LPSLAQLALTSICHTTTTTSYPHMPILLAMSTKAMLWAAIKTLSHIF
jgi:hypothetical protein